jgi:N-acetylglucosamine-6-phosphate deacetylase
MATVFSNARKVDVDGVVDDFWMLVDGDSIVEVGSGVAPASGERVDLAGRTITPGFIDLHCHGGGGYAFDDGDDDIVAALATHRAHGTTRSVISLVSNPVAMLRDSLETVADLVEDDPLILGSHLEGPYLADARRGAHNPEYLREADAIELDSLIDAARGTLRQVTLAPERAGALDAIARLVEAGVAVAVGHTEADYATAREAFSRGATLLTHAFNAMAGIHHRAPGPIVAAYADERVIIELILDGIHVHPQVARSAFAAAPGRIALVTDAMAAAGNSDGDYRLGSLNVAVREGRAMLRGTATIAGSTLTQDAALRCAIESVGVDPVEAVAALTSTPARALRLDGTLGRLAPGYAADAVVLDHAWHVEQVWAAGRRL